MRTALSALLPLSLLVAFAPAEVPDPKPPVPLFAGLGKHSRPVATSKPEAQQYFDQGLNFMFAFNHDEAIRAFRRATELDPECAMAYWGISLARWGNPFGGQRAPNSVTMGKADIDKGLSTGSPTAREKGYITAAAELFRDSDPGTQRARVVAYAAGMEKVAKDNPADMEATIFYALATLAWCYALYAAYVDYSCTASCGQRGAGAALALGLLGCAYALLEGFLLTARRRRSA